MLILTCQHAYDKLICLYMLKMTYVIFRPEVPGPICVYVYIHICICTYIYIYIYIYTNILNKHNNDNNVICPITITIKTNITITTITITITITTTTTTTTTTYCPTWDRVFIYPTVALTCAMSVNIVIRGEGVRPIARKVWWVFICIKYDDWVRPRCLDPCDAVRLRAVEVCAEAALSILLLLLVLSILLVLIIIIMLVDYYYWYYYYSYYDY